MKLKLMKRESCSSDGGDRQSDTSSRRSKSIGQSGAWFGRWSGLVLHSNQGLNCLAITKGANQARSFDIRESFQFYSCSLASRTFLNYLRIITVSRAELNYFRFLPVHSEPTANFPSTSHIELPRMYS